MLQLYIDSNIMESNIKTLKYAITNYKKKLCLNCKYASGTKRAQHFDEC